jgi:hypothetical protein
MENKDSKVDYYSVKHLQQLGFDQATIAQSLGINEYAMEKELKNQKRKLEATTSEPIGREDVERKDVTETNIGKHMATSESSKEFAPEFREEENIIARPEELVPVKSRKSSGKKQSAVKQQHSDATYGYTDDVEDANIDPANFRKQKAYVLFGIDFRIHSIVAKATESKLSWNSIQLKLGQQGRNSFVALSCIDNANNVVTEGFVVPKEAILESLAKMERRGSSATISRTPLATLQLTVPNVRMPEHIEHREL